MSVVLGLVFVVDFRRCDFFGAFLVVIIQIVLDAVIFIEYGGVIASALTYDMFYWG
jgi:hypothetical protein